MARTPRPLADRFWPRVSVGRAEMCWLWQGSLAETGYGKLCDEDGSKIYAHRAAARLTGRDPTGKVVLHLCDTRRCTNPAHLVVGTLRDNIADMVAKRRHVFGSRMYNAKLD